jgi:hypothetical protein
VWTTGSSPPRTSTRWGSRSHSRYVYVSEDAPFSVATRDRPYYRLVRARAYVNDHRHERAFVSDVTERVLERIARNRAGVPQEVTYVNMWYQCSRYRRVFTPWESSHRVMG